MQGFRRRQISRSSFAVLLLAVCMFRPGGTAIAETPAALERPQGRVLLTVTGEIARSNVAGRAELDRAMLEALGVRKLVTSTPWTDGTPVFRGVLLQDLLDHLGAKGAAVQALALNDYRCEIARSEFENYPVLIAFEMNGKPLSVRDKGPLWIVYPLDQFAELRNRETERKMIWQLMQLAVE